MLVNIPQGTRVCRLIMKWKWRRTGDISITCTSCASRVTSTYNRCWRDRTANCGAGYSRSTLPTQPSRNTTASTPYVRLLIIFFVLSLRRFPDAVLWPFTMLFISWEPSNLIIIINRLLRQVIIWSCLCCKIFLSKCIKISVNEKRSRHCWVCRMPFYGPPLYSRLRPDV